MKECTKIEKVYKNKLLYIDNELRIEFNKGFLIYKKKDTEYKINLHKKIIYRFLSKSLLMERCLRLEPRWMTRVNENEFLLSHSGHLSMIDFTANKQTIVFQYSKGTNNPLHFCEYTRNNVQEIVFGDYGGSDENGKIGIFRYKNGDISKIATIEARLINHIHRIEYDQYRDCYWVFTGDFDAGTGIWKLKYDDSYVDPYLIGKQSYRACFAYVLEKSIIYATDSPNDPNYIFEMSIEDKKIKKIGHLPGSCIYGIKINNDIVCLSTTVEQDSTLPRWRYIFSYKLGRGINDRYSHVFLGNHKNGFKEIWKTKKDIFPMTLFQFGNVRFPTQRKEKEIFIFPQSCRAEGTYAIKISGGNK